MEGVRLIILLSCLTIAPRGVNHNLLKLDIVLIYDRFL
jgi:hypothetical protein